MWLNIDSWIEPNYNVKQSVENYMYISPNDDADEDYLSSNLYSQNKPFLLHIQMELCSISLRDIIVNYNHKGHNLLTPECYASACEILSQILNGLKYLHEHNPIIIYRDLKPENILIIQSEGQTLVKLSDFGLSAFHQRDDHIHTKYIGSPRYRAPEVLYDNLYDTKCDIYSLGVIIQELFNINLNQDFFVFNPILDSKYKVMIEIIMKCLKSDRRSRLNCIDIIEMSDFWYYAMPETFDFDSMIHEIRLSLTIVNPTNFYSYITEKNKTIAVNIDGTLYSSYKNKVQDICVLGRGCYGEVWLANAVNDNKSYAIKKIKVLTDIFEELKKYVKREVKFLSELDDKYVVKYIDSWIDKNYYIDKDQSTYPFLMHIQMELCCLTLQDITFAYINPKQLGKYNRVSALRNSREVFETLYYKNINLLNFVGYFIASELLIEILQGVDYLHNLKPAVMHRDLKPSNILITSNGNERFVKLADFGLATLHEYVTQSHTIGVGSYTYPDVNYGSYNTKSDIYCLHYIVSELFNTNVNSDVNTESPLHHKYVQLQTIIIDMSNIVSKKRPNCSEILQNKHLWGLNFNEAQNDCMFKSILSQSSENCDLLDNFTQIFIQSKHKSHLKLFNRKNTLSLI